MKTKVDVMKDLARVRRRKIIIQKQIITEDDIGNQIETWTDWKTLKAEKTGLWGQEYYAARAVNEEATVVFSIRYAAFVEQMDTKNRIVYDGRAYDIKHIDRLKDGGMWVKIRALERGGLKQ